MAAEQATRKDAVCPHCGGPATRVLRSRDDNRRVNAYRFAYFRCHRCKLLFLDPIPEDLGQYYPDAYYPMPETLAGLDRIAQRQRHRIELVRRYAPGGRLLDVGAAQGLFAHLAKQAGFEVETIEMDEKCCRYLRDVVGVGVVRSDDPAAVLPGMAPPGVITFWHVVEHLSDPWSSLRRAAALLPPGGVLVVATPNPEALQFRLLGPRWVHLDAPRHVHLIPAPLLAHELAAHDLHPVLTTSDDEGTRAFTMNGWRRSLMNLSRFRPLEVAAAGVGTGIGLVARVAESGGLRGAAYTAVFRKGHDGAPASRSEAG